MSQQADSSAVDLGAGASAHGDDLLPQKSASGKGAAMFGRLAGSWVSTWLILVSLSAFAASLLLILKGAQRGFFVVILAISICVLAAMFDAFTTRIPNRLTYTAILAGLLLNALAAGFTWLVAHKFPAAHGAVLWLGAPGILQSLLALAVCLPLAIGGLLFHIGGGDLKLLVALGTLLGFSELGYVVILSISVALVYGIINLLVAGRLNRVLRVAALRGLELFFLRKLPPDDTEHLPGSRVPMAVPLAIGLIWSQLMPAGILMGIL